MNLNTGRTGAQLIRDRQCGLLFGGIEAYLRFLGTAVLDDICFLEFNLGGIQRDGAARLHDFDVYDFLPGERGFLQIRSQVDAVMLGHNIPRKALRSRQERDKESNEYESFEMHKFSCPRQADQQ